MLLGNRKCSGKGYVLWMVSLHTILSTRRWSTGSFAMTAAVAEMVELAEPLRPHGLADLAICQENLYCKLEAPGLEGMAVRTRCGHLSLASGRLPALPDHRLRL